MNPFTWQAPTKYVFGPGVVDQVGEELAAQGWNKVLLVYGQGSAKRSGLLDRVKDALAAAGVSCVEHGGARPNPEVTFVRAGIDLARAESVDAVLALGGGSVIDASKAIGFGTLYDGDVWDFFAKKAKVAECLPICVVLTMPGAGSEGSSSCVLNDDSIGKKASAAGDAFRPRVAFMDPELTVTLPAYQTAAGVTDMIAHVCERSFSGVGPVPVTDNIAYGIIRSLIEETPRVLENPNDLDARSNIMWAGTLAHNGLVGCGRGLTLARAGGWESHGLEHAMSAYDARITHGAGLAVILPAWMRHVWTVDPERFLLFGREVFGIEPVEEGDEGYEGDELAREWAIEAAIDELAAFFQSIGMPATLDEFGLTRDDIDELADRVIADKGEPFGAFAKLDREDVVAIYESAFD
ncbi:MAG: iron-containing alcohol dehydrogenase [Coriobacteriales bacterium]|jgi:alcohol dehydrogenase YqhD (iron-dependent ADH family)